MSSKEGYEAALLPEEQTPLMEKADNATQTPAADPAGLSQQAPRTWHGHLLNPFGSCDATGWSTCLITHCEFILLGKMRTRLSLRRRRPQAVPLRRQQQD